MDVAAPQYSQAAALSTGNAMLDRVNAVGARLTARNIPGHMYAPPGEPRTNYIGPPARIGPNALLMIREKMVALGMKTDSIDRQLAYYDRVGGGAKGPGPVQQGGAPVQQAAGGAAQVSVPQHRLYLGGGARG
jgi:hypothetical protein